MPARFVNCFKFVVLPIRFQPSYEKETGRRLEEKLLYLTENCMKRQSRIAATAKWTEGEEADFRTVSMAVVREEMVLEEFEACSERMSCYSL
jgi:hypothetical protein